jgi:hypothetical protein
MGGNIPRRNRQRFRKVCSSSVWHSHVGPSWRSRCVIREQTQSSISMPASQQERDHRRDEIHPSEQELEGNERLIFGRLVDGNELGGDGHD